MYLFIVQLFSSSQHLGVVWDFLLSLFSQGNLKTFTFFPNRSCLWRMKHNSLPSKDRYKGGSIVLAGLVWHWLETHSAQHCLPTVSEMGSCTLAYSPTDFPLGLCVLVFHLQNEPLTTIWNEVTLWFRKGCFASIRNFLFMYVTTNNYTHVSLRQIVLGSETHGYVLFKI